MRAWERTGRDGRVAAVAALALWAGAAWGEPGAGGKPPTDAGQTLRGPEVTESDAPAPGRTFGGGDARSARETLAAEEMFRRAVGALLRPDAPAGLALSAEQRAVIEKESREFEAEAQAYRRQHGREIRELRRAMGQPEGPGAGGAGGAGAPAAPMAEPDPAARAKAMERLQQIERSRPDFSARRERVWSALDGAQRAFVTEHVEKARAEAMEARTKQRLDELRREGEAAGAKGKPGAGGAGGAGAADPASREERINRLGQRLGLSAQQVDRLRAALLAPPTPAERGMTPQDRMASRIDGLPSDLVTPQQKAQLKSVLAERGGGRPGAPAAGRGRGEDVPASGKPAPDMGDVDVPKP